MHQLKTSPCQTVPIIHAYGECHRAPHGSHIGWGRESWLLRFGCILAGEEIAGCLNLVVFLLGKRESWLLMFGCVLAGEERELIA